jgi:hypothetical protein
LIFVSRARGLLRDSSADSGSDRGRVAIVVGFAALTGAAAFAFAVSEGRQSAKAELQFDSPRLRNFGSLDLGAPGQIELTPRILGGASDSAGVSSRVIRRSTSVGLNPRSGGWTISATSATTAGAKEIADAVASELRARYQRLLSRRTVLGLRYLDLLQHREKLRRSGEITRASLRTDKEALLDFRRLVEKGRNPKLFRAQLQPSPFSAGALARAVIAALGGLLLSLLVIALYDRVGHPERGAILGIRRGS